MKNGMQQVSVLRLDWESVIAIENVQGCERKYENNVTSVLKFCLIWLTENKVFLCVGRETGVLRVYPIKCYFTPCDNKIICWLFLSI